MLDFFGTAWRDLSVETVEAFLREAGDEGLNWEAKGREEPHRDTIRKAACGFANAAGGFLIIGAERNGPHGWLLNGVAFRSSEPTTWLSSVIADGGLSPPPPFDAKLFDRADGGAAAVLAVGCIAAPPCITATGIVYQRVTGQTLPVTDQRVLSDLFARGRTARHQAETGALGAAQRGLHDPRLHEATHALFTVAICPVRGADDITTSLFSGRFAEFLRDVVRRRLQVDPMVAFPVNIDVAQDRVRAFHAAPHHADSWTLAVYWDGSASAVFATPDEQVNVMNILIQMRKGWEVIIEAVRECRGQGESHLVVRVNGGHAAVARRPHPTSPVQRWTGLADPSEDELGAVSRELQRGFGEHEWEPEPTHGGG